MATHLGPRDVSLYVTDNFLAGLHQQPYPTQVAHGSADAIQARLVAEQPRHTMLELIDRRILGVDIITNRGGQYSLPHLLGWPGHGVRAQIDHEQESDVPPEKIKK
jgi:hypothetical protein